MNTYKRQLPLIVISELLLSCALGIPRLHLRSHASESVRLYLLNFSRCASKQFDVSGSDALTVLRQGLGRVLFRSKEDEGIARRSSIWLVNEQNAILSI